MGTPTHLSRDYEASTSHFQGQSYRTLLSLAAIRDPKSAHKPKLILSVENYAYKNFDLS